MRSLCLRKKALLQASYHLSPQNKPEVGRVCAVPFSSKDNTARAEASCRVCAHARAPQSPGRPLEEAWVCPQESGAGPQVLLLGLPGQPHLHRCPLGLLPRRLGPTGSSKPPRCCFFHSAVLIALSLFLFSTGPLLNQKTINTAFWCCHKGPSGVLAGPLHMLCAQIQAR